LFLWIVYGKEVMRLAGSRGWCKPAEANQVAS
jgi:hypothetical protein